MTPLSFAFEVQSSSDNPIERPARRSECRSYDVHAQIEFDRLLEEIRNHEGEAVAAPFSFQVVVAAGSLMIVAGITGLGLGFFHLIQ